jgi:hypothetical protein
MLLGTLAGVCGVAFGWFEWGLLCFFGLGDGLGPLLDWLCCCLTVGCVTMCLGWLLPWWAEPPLDDGLGGADGADGVEGPELELEGGGELVVLVDSLAEEDDEALVDSLVTVEEGPLSLTTGGFSAGAAPSVAGQARLAAVSPPPVIAMAMRRSSLREALIPASILES